MSMLRTLIFVLTLTLGSVSVCAQAEWDWQTCNDGRDPVAAIAACSRLIDGGVLGDLGLATALYNRGVHFANVEEIDRAITDQSRAIQIEPLHPRAYNARGNAYYKKGDVEHAIQDYDAQIKIAPRHEDAYNGRGRAYLAKGELDRATGALRRRQSLPPSSAVTWICRDSALPCSPTSST